MAQSRPGGAVAVFLPLVLSVVTLLGCALPTPKAPPPYLACTSSVPGYHYDAYKALCDGAKRAEEGSTDVLTVTAYADQLLEAAGGLELSIDDAEWQARTGRASELLDGVMSKLTAGDVSKWYLKKGMLEIHAFGHQDARCEQSFSKALDAGGGWEAGATLVTLYAERKFPGKVGIDACQRTYQAGIAEKKDYQALRSLVDTCKGLVIGAKDPKNPYTSIEPEYWDELRALAAAK